MKLFKLPILKSIIDRFDSDIANFGFQKAFANIIKNSNTKLEIIKKDKSINEILANKPVIVVANHPFEIEPLILLGSMPNRIKASK